MGDELTNVLDEKLSDLNKSIETMKNGSNGGLEASKFKGNGKSKEKLGDSREVKGNFDIHHSTADEQNRDTEEDVEDLEEGRDKHPQGEAEGPGGGKFDGFEGVTDRSEKVRPPDLKKGVTDIGMGKEEGESESGDVYPESDAESASDVSGHAKDSSKSDNAEKGKNAAAKRVNKKAPVPSLRKSQSEDDDEGGDDEKEIEVEVDLPKGAKVEKSICTCHGHSPDCPAYVPRHAVAANGRMKKSFGTTENGVGERIEELIKSFNGLARDYDIDRSKSTEVFDKVAGVIDALATQVSGLQQTVDAMASQPIRKSFQPGARNIQSQSRFQEPMNKSMAADTLTDHLQKIDQRTNPAEFAMVKNDILKLGLGRSVEEISPASRKVLGIQ